LNSNSGDFLLHVALQGQGIANLPDFILKDNLQTGALVPILPAFSMPEFFIYLIRSDKRRMNRRMRLFAQEMTLACL
jgi:DNA-binding transcriptional LysR family regulator